MATITADSHGYRRQPRLSPTATATADSHGYRRRPQLLPTATATATGLFRRSVNDKKVLNQIVDRKSGSSF